MDSDGDDPMGYQVRIAEAVAGGLQDTGATLIGGAVAGAAGAGTGAAVGGAIGMGAFGPPGAAVGAALGGTIGGVVAAGTAGAAGTGLMISDAVSGTSRKRANEEPMSEFNPNRTSTPNPAVQGADATMSDPTSDVVSATGISSNEMEIPRGPVFRRDTMTRTFTQKYKFIVHQPSMKRGTGAVLHKAPANFIAAIDNYGHYYIPDNFLGFYMNGNDWLQMGRFTKFKIHRAGWETNKMAIYRFVGSNPATNAAQYTANEMGAPSMYQVSPQLFQEELPQGRILSYSDNADDADWKPIEQKFDVFQVGLSRMNNNMWNALKFLSTCKGSAHPQTLPQYTFVTDAGLESNDFSERMDLNRMEDFEIRRPLGTPLKVEKHPIKCWRKHYLKMGHYRSTNFAKPSPITPSTIYGDLTSEAYGQLMPDSAGSAAIGDRRGHDAYDLWVGAEPKLNASEAALEEAWFATNTSAYYTAGQPIGKEVGMEAYTIFKRVNDRMPLHEPAIPTNAPTLIRINPQITYENFDPHCFVVMDLEASIDIEFSWGDVGRHGYNVGKMKPIDNAYDTCQWCPMDNWFTSIPANTWTPAMGPLDAITVQAHTVPRM